MAFVIVFTIVFSMPKFVWLHIGPNIYDDREGGLDVPSMHGLSYIMMPTRFYDLLFGNKFLVILVFVVEFWIPVPLLFVFQVLTYKKVQLYNLLFTG